MSESFIKFDAFWYVKSGTLVREYQYFGGK